MIKVKALNLTFGTFRLEVEELKVKEGEVLALIGPNGAGKTTFLNALGLLRRTDSGEIRIMGKDALAPENKMFLRRGMSVVFSQPYLTNDTVFNNVALPLKLRGVKDRAAVAETMELFKISHLSWRNAKTLSQGESHRTALARAFVTKPKLVLLDEPFSSLDERVKETIIRDLGLITRAAKSAVVLVTQDQADALTICDTLAVLVNGRLLQHGEPQEIFSRPASKEVADFVGVETILNGEVAGKSDNLCSVRVGAATLEVISECSVGDKVLLCVRPEAVSVSRAPAANSMRNHFKGTIISLEPWRLEYKISMDCGFNLIAAVTKRSLDELELKPGDEVFASFKATAAHLIRR